MSKVKTNIPTLIHIAVGNILLKEIMADDENGI